MAGIFKAYDVRGLYPSEVDETKAEKIGYYFSKHLIEKYKGKKIVIGKDGRIGSTKLLNAFIKGASKTKLQITTIGTCSTPALYYTCAKEKFDAGIMITASHNPKEYNGIKIVLKNAVPFDFESGFNKIEKMFLQEKKIPSKTYKKSIKKQNLDLYINKITSLFKSNNLDKANLKIVVDTSNGVTASTLPKVFKNLNLKYNIINKKIDKNFSGHDPNPYDPKNLKQLQKEVKRLKADIGIIFDGDGDRVFFVDEKSTILDSATSGEILINYLLEKSNKSSNFTFDVRTSKSVIDLIKFHKNKFFVSKVGHSNIKKTMTKKKSLLGFENSGHFMHKSLYNIDDALYTALLMLEIRSKKDEKLSIIKNNFSNYYSINKDFKTKFSNSKELIRIIEKKYKNAKITKLDGISLDFKTWWCNIRTSNTEPVVRLFLEGINKKIIDQKMKEIVNLVKA